ncbi:RnfABCDGE type electron transport complex subunit D [Candidatus Nomurabacteria bacterium]|nr:RnfABCDGE type electron transport complex subunit D [Candidatus Nomurabacteria bacterium]
MVHLLSKPFHSLQQFVDRIGMYRLVLGSLFVLAFCSVLAGFTGDLAYSGLSQIFALALALLVALSLNWVIALITKIPANHESAAITALILFFLTIPEENIFANWPLVLAVVIAILSKFLITTRRQHFLNPAAFGAAALSLTGVYIFNWWVGNPTLFIPLIIFGTLVVMKVRKWVPVLAFLGVSLIVYLAESFSNDVFLHEATQTFFLSGPALFLAFYMLTEPFTMPAMKGPQFLYGGLVGFLSSTSMFSAWLYISPELALVMANMLMLPWRLRQKLFLEFMEKRQIAQDTWEFIFKKPKGFSFQAGQYLEWMLPHEAVDSRGPRRYFTIASAPTENTVRLAFKLVEQGSSYKRELMKLDVGEKIIASQLAGDFVLPSDSGVKLGFIAGGIGVTPFRSHIQFMADSGQVHDTKLLYCCNTMAELAYNNEFAAAATAFPLEVIPVIAKEEVAAPLERGYVTVDMLTRRVPDYLERVWYLSGPPPMVNAYTKLLHDAGVPSAHIICDFFPGLA